MLFRSEVTNYFFSIGETTSVLELTFNHDGRTYELGTGYGHIALAVDDMAATLAELAGQGIEPEREPYRLREGGSLICFVRDPDDYRIEIVDSELVAIRDEGDASGKGRADLRICGTVPEEGIGLALFVDHDTGRMVVTDSDGREPLADLTLPPGAGSAERTLRLEFGGKGVELRSLRVAPWKGDSFGSDLAEGKALLLRDGTAIALAMPG